MDISPGSAAVPASRPAAETRPALSTMDGSTLAALLTDLGAPPWRARQVEDAVWRPGSRSLDDVRQLPAGLRVRLAARVRFSTVEVAAEQVADGGATVKLLCRLADGQTVEAVAMESAAAPGRRRRATVCVSSQVGCAVGCPFCATGHMGLRRSCSAAEIVDQVRAAGSALHARGLGPVTHVVYMGMGEPLAAYESTVRSLRVLTGRMGLSPRRITVSTSGLVSGIERLSSEDIPVTLAVSLHAGDDALRDRLVPLNRTNPLERVLAAAAGYASQTGRRLTFEWCLISGVNDRPEDADRLCALAHRHRAHVNVIPMNRITGSPWRPPSAAGVRRFLDHLDAAATTVRDTRGTDADAACGQLRAALERRRSLRPDGTLTPPAAPPRVAVPASTVPGGAP